MSRSNPREDSWGLPTPRQNAEDYEPAVGDDDSDDSKWIHRDKLAKIESEELQAAGFIVPRSRGTSKQRRDRSRSAMRRGTDASEQSHHARSRKNSTAADSAAWDLRTPEEIAEEEAANHYFATNSVKGGSGSRIPVKKPTPAPISMDNLDRGSNPGPRPKSGNPDDNNLAYSKNRSRSTSVKLLDSAGPDSSLQPAKRSATDTSPKKSATGGRKGSAPAKTGNGANRPKTRGGTNRDSSNNSTTRPTTRSGELSPGNKAPEGDPPWMINAYKPDPRLPPDQQLLPTVARRLQQEQWEKEGKFGDVYDKDFRPLNDNFLKPPEAEAENETDKGQQDEEGQQQGDEWPLRADAVKSPTQRSGSYSTMPKISDKPQASPLPSPRTPATPHMPPQEQPAPKPEKPAPERVPEPPEEEEKKGGCGCCVVM